MKVLAFGEVLWDVMEDGKHIGGAALNFAAHLSSIGVESYLVSSVGDDEDGKEILDILKEKKINDAFINISRELPTGKVLVELDNAIPSYTICENAAWDYIKPDLSKLKSASDPQDIVYFGSLAQRSESNREYLSRLLNSQLWKYLFYDVNLRSNYYSKEIIDWSMSKANIVKINDEEAIVISEMFLDGEQNIEKIATLLREKFGLLVVIITCGKKGVFVCEEGNSEFIGTGDVKVIDTVGAGDSFSAAFMFAYSLGNNAVESAKVGSKLADFVVSHSGAVPDYNDEIRNMFRKLKNNSI